MEPRVVFVQLKTGTNSVLHSDRQASFICWVCLKCAYVPSVLLYTYWPSYPFIADTQSAVYNTGFENTYLVVRYKTSLLRMQICFMYGALLLRILISCIYNAVIAVTSLVGTASLLPM